LDLDFSPENDIPNAISIWVRLNHLPFHCWGDDTLRSIGNSLGKHIEKAEPKDGLQAYARICVEVDLEKGLSPVVNLTLENWSYIQ